MKQHILFVTLYAILAGMDTSYAQSCTGCTSTITGTDTMTKIVSAGSKLCITSTGNLTGDIYVNGGEVCNLGAINSSKISILYGTLRSYGSINTDTMSVLGNGDTITIQGTANINTIFLNGSLDFENSSTLTGDVLAVSSGNVSIINSGNFAVNTIGINDTYINNSGNILSDTINITNGILDNSGNLTVDTIYTVNTDINNSGAMLINYDISSVGGMISNTGDMNVGHNLVSHGTFYTECMIPVGNNWTNHGTVSGPLSGCGGFSVGDTTANYGNFGTDSSYIDMCDAGSPGNGFDFSSGSVGINVTYCSCANNCAIISSISSQTQEQGFKLYPNPTSTHATLEFDNSTNESHTLTLYDVRGQLVKTINNITINRIEIETNYLSSGLYFLRLNRDGQVYSTGKLIIE